MPSAALMLVLRRTLRDEMWGLLSSPLPPGSFGRCMQQLVRCATLGEALREGFAHHRLVVAPGVGQSAFARKKLSCNSPIF